MAEVNLQKRFRDTVNDIVPLWLRDRPGFDVGYRVLWAGMATLDALLDILMAAQRAARPGHGLDEPGLAVTSALPLVGASRGIIRGEDDTDEEFAAKLRAWLDEHRDMASQEVIARVLHGYISGHPRVRVIQRGGHDRGLPTWVTVDTDGEVTTEEAPFDWDSVSNPERNTAENLNWSDLFIVVYPGYEHRSQVYGPGMTWGGDEFGIGHYVTRQAWDAILGQLAYWKGAHSKIRAVIWTSDEDLFDPAVPLSNPNGKWGNWSVTDGSGNNIPSDRDLVSCRFWTPR